MANWLQKSLDNVNMDLAKLENDKAESIRAEIRIAKSEAKALEEKSKTDCPFYGEVEDSLVWSTTLEEKNTKDEMREKLNGYVPRHEIQEDVLKYLTPKTNGSVRQYVKIIPSESRKSEDLERYVNASHYWRKENTDIKGRNGENIKWTFAVNTQMKAVICRYRKYFIITSFSSHKNIMKELEGKKMKRVMQWNNPNQPKDTVEQILELL